MMDTFLPLSIVFAAMLLLGSCDGAFQVEQEESARGTKTTSVRLNLSLTDDTEVTGNTFGRVAAGTRV